MIMNCPNCGGMLLSSPWPAVSWQCQQCGAKYLTSVMTTTSTAQVKYSVYGLCGVHPKQEVPKAFQDAFAGKELEP